MEPMLSFIAKFTNVVKSHIEETKEIIGKEVVDSSARKTGVCIDKIKVAFGAKFSLLGHQYSQEETKQIDGINEDVLVCQGTKNRFFVPVSEVLAVGESVLLVRPDLGLQEVDGSLNRRKDEIFRKFFNTKESIKEFLPKVEGPRPQIHKKKRSITHLFH
jgi:sporulation protein YlmC with PRC-barrel domain